MLSTTAAIAVIVVLGAWHLHNRRHAGWQASADGRFYILCGYPLVAVAAYWLTTALNSVTAEHARAAVQMETIESATGSIRF